MENTNAANTDQTSRSELLYWRVLTKTFYRSPGACDLCLLNLYRTKPDPMSRAKLPVGGRSALCAAGITASVLLRDQTEIELEQLYDCMRGYRGGRLSSHA